MIKNYQPKYRVEVRSPGITKVPCISPFITMPDETEWNVWDIPENYYTETIELAIKHAFELGYKAAVQTREPDFFEGQF
jgi:hypothetical protein